MSLDNVTPGKHVPAAFNVIIEIPMNADPVKYEVDKETGAIFVDRFMSTSMHYPTNYGYVPKTISGDGDPVDVLVITPVPLIPGVVVTCRPLGILMMEDEAGQDGKVLAVPTDVASRGLHIGSACVQIGRKQQRQIVRQGQTRQGRQRRKRRSRSSPDQSAE